MLISYNLAPLRRIVDGIYNITGMAITVLDPYYNEIRGQGKHECYCERLVTLLGNYNKCANCDNELIEKCKRSGKMEYHICHAGLCDMAMPIIKDDEIVAYVLMGRIRLKDYLQVQKYNFSDDELNRLFYEIPVLSKEQIEALADLMGYIIFENAIHIERDKTIDKITAYIKENLKEPLSVEYLCKNFAISKTSLYDMFARKLEKPVNQYIIEARVGKAKDLLRNTNMSVGQVAKEVGILNQTYFCKLFKKHAGISPKEFKQQKRIVTSL